MLVPLIVAYSPSFEVEYISTLYPAPFAPETPVETRGQPRRDPAVELEVGSALGEFNHAR
ncbi:hypothetical protein AKJ65_04915 [candidate division MSBL1 archaeon SCGC-AAA259E19]|uniref:Uncharacterized protein n=1 Tax=candidate division MSBL1 archaeon SCGC-AAA259E19 TaxID=1698264 RepID=A0A133UJ96_9EURY|nr:hypothetical protein AKJ65_04915 [candidate division MSBL1 archaeon SCGC-AAA259E19]